MAFTASVCATCRAVALVLVCCLIFCAEHVTHAEAFAATGSAVSTPTKITAPPAWDELSQSLEELTTKEHDETPKVTLYRDTNGWCPFCERVWVALRAKGIQYDEQLISLQNKPSWYKALVPTTLVPAVLFHGDGSSNERRIVWESADILRSLDEEFPDTPKMMHDDANFEEALQMNEDLQSAGLAFVYGGRNATLTDKEKMDRRTKFLAELDRLDAALQEQADGNFRLGSKFTGIDAIMVPTLERWRYQLPITADIDILEGRPGLVSWFEAMDAYEPYAGRVRANLNDPIGLIVDNANSSSRVGNEDACIDKDTAQFRAVLSHQSSLEYLALLVGKRNRRRKGMARIESPPMLVPAHHQKRRVQDKATDQTLSKLDRFNPQKRRVQDQAADQTLQRKYQRLHLTLRSSPSGTERQKSLCMGMADLGIP